MTKGTTPRTPLHDLTKQNRSQRYMKQTTFDNNNSYTTNRDSYNPQITSDNINENMKQIHIKIVQNYLQNREHNKIIHQQAPAVDRSEEKLPRPIRRTLAQLRTGKSPFLQTYVTKSTQKTTLLRFVHSVNKKNIPPTTSSPATISKPHSHLLTFGSSLQKSDHYSNSGNLPLGRMELSRLALAY